MVHRNKMSPTQRAKQFMPFAALKGFEEALCNTERENRWIPRPEMSEDDSEQINIALNSLKRYSKASVSIYEDGEILYLSGIVNWIDADFKYLLLDFRQIDFKNILSVHIEDSFTSGIYNE